LVAGRARAQLAAAGNDAFDPVAFTVSWNSAAGVGFSWFLLAKMLYTSGRPHEPLFPAHAEGSMSRSDRFVECQLPFSWEGFAPMNP